MAYQDNDDHLEFRVAPYQFEPTKKPSDIKDSSSLNEESSGSDNDDVISSPRALNEWCTCGNCVVMPTDRENMCCQRFTLCREKMEANQLKCVTFHDAFRVNCLNRDVLELAFYDYLDINGHIGDKEPVHQLYRHIAYRRFARWLWHRLGRKNRKVLPSCVVNCIRQNFPSEEYSGFKYPRDY